MSAGHGAGFFYPQDEPAAEEQKPQAPPKAEKTQPQPTKRRETTVDEQKHSEAE